jgi:hypothetical protein
MVMPPAEALPVVITVSVVEPEPVTVVGLKLPVTPEGSPDVPKLTVPLNPLFPVTVTVYAALPPAATLPGPADIPIEKSGAGATLPTVQLPYGDQPLSCEAFSTSIYTFFAPANPVVKLKARVSVKVVPDADADEAPAFTAHWLFCNVPVRPSGSGPCHAPVSLAR